ncbi:hypothetical protein GCM10009733_110220 [Nonomuraea maheshkhaliensis]|uniref:MafI family immunity protein n=1 Tax=Nonomuraea maheshkhaliensis TaxID=419590 RepID=A0ABP4U3Q0_9ACTN
MQREDALIRTLAELVVDLAWFFESCDDSTLDSRDAVRQLEWIAYKLDALSAEDRLRLIALIRERAETEADPAFREFMEGFPEAAGLNEEDG